MGEENRTHKSERRKKGLHRKAKKVDFGAGGDNFEKPGHRSGKTHKFPKGQDNLTQTSSVVRKQVDPETSKYFSEIANLFESNGVELEERSVICGNALEETRGKEYEVATDYIISHTLQTLLEGCEIDHLCGFLQNCSRVFPLIAMDRSGSHVAETALRSITVHLQEEEAIFTIEETLTMICRAIVSNGADLLRNCYGSHVLRRLLCLLKGVSLDSPEYLGSKSLANVAERLNLKASRTYEHDAQNLWRGFPSLLKLLLSGLLNCFMGDKTLLVDQFSSMVLQTALKLLVGDDEELLRIIPIILGFNKEGNNISIAREREVKNLVRETSYSHLLEVVLEVAPENAYNDMFSKIFRNLLFEMSCDQCGSFVVQALISKARSQEQMELIWEELGTKVKDLLEMGRSGVIAALVAACHRLQVLEYKCCQAITAAVCSADDSPTCVVPRILFLDNYFRSQDHSSWKWPSNVKMHVMGSLILQAVFRCRNEYMQPFAASITSMEVDHLVEAAKDSTGAHVIEAFLDSSASGKRKHNLILKLREHFGELSMHPSGCFTVEKCFTVSDVSVREAIVSELVAVRSELSKTKHGPRLVKKLDIYGYTSHPNQWKSRQASKQSAYNEFRSLFGSSKTEHPGNDSSLPDISEQASQGRNIKQMRKEIDACLSSLAPSLALRKPKPHPEKAESHGEKGKNSKKRKDHGGLNNAIIASKSSENEVKDERLPDSLEMFDKKRHRKDKQSELPKRKLKK